MYDPPFISALMTKGRIEVRTFNPSILIQNIALSRPSFLCAGNKYLKLSELIIVVQWTNLYRFIRWAKQDMGAGYYTRPP